MIMKALKYISAITLVALAATSCVIRFDKDKMLKALEDHKKFIEDSMFVEDSTQSEEDNVEDSSDVCCQDDTVSVVKAE